MSCPNTARTAVAASIQDLNVVIADLLYNSCERIAQRLLARY